MVWTLYQIGPTAKYQRHANGYSTLQISFPTTIGKKRQKKKTIAAEWRESRPKMAAFFLWNVSQLKLKNGQGSKTDNKITGRIWTPKARKRI